MTYIDGFVVAVPTANREAYVTYAGKAAEIFKDLGALRLVEAWGDDVPTGKTTDFYMAVKAKPEETVLFSWIEWPSKEVRDAAMARMMEDPRFKEMGEMPFDGQRMIYGGFLPVVDV